ncbi:MAG: hypothetical protein RSA79_01075 [Oscillospiraceae bacterium]
MKKTIAIVIGSVAIITLGILGYFVYQNHIQAKLSLDEVKPTIIVNDKKYVANRSTPEDSFLFIKEKEAFSQASFFIKKAISHDKLPTENLTTNFKSVVNQEIFTSTINTTDIYVKVIVNDDTRYYRFSTEQI